MPDNRQEYRITFASGNFDAFAAVDVKAYDENHAVELAKGCLRSDFAPQLHHIEKLT